MAVIDTGNNFHDCIENVKQVFKDDADGDNTVGLKSSDDVHSYIADFYPQYPCIVIWPDTPCIIPRRVATATYRMTYQLRVDVHVEEVDTEERVKEFAQTVHNAVKLLINHFQLNGFAEDSEVGEVEPFAIGNSRRVIWVASIPLRIMANSSSTVSAVGD